MDIEIFHFHQELSDITVIVDRSHFPLGICPLHGWDRSVAAPVLQKRARTHIPLVLSNLALWSFVASRLTEKWGHRLLPFGLGRTGFVVLRHSIANCFGQRNPRMVTPTCVYSELVFLHKAGGSAGTLVRCPKVLAITREQRLNCSSFSVSYASCGQGEGLWSHLPFLISSGLLPDPSLSSSGSPPPPGAPAALPHRGGGGGGFPPPAAEASGLRSDALPFPFTSPIKFGTIAFSSEISLSCASWASWCCTISC